MRFLPLLLLLLLSACSSNKSQQIEQMATELCDCMRPLATLYEEVIAASTASDSIKMNTLLQEFQVKSEEGEKCAAALEEKYGDLSEADQDQANTAFTKTCPEIAAMLSAEDE